MYRLIILFGPREFCGEELAGATLRFYRINAACENFRSFSRLSDYGVPLYK